MNTCKHFILAQTKYIVKSTMPRTLVISQIFRLFLKKKNYLIQDKRTLFSKGPMDYGRYCKNIETKKKSKVEFFKRCYENTIIKYIFIIEFDKTGLYGQTVNAFVWEIIE